MEFVDRQVRYPSRVLVTPESGDAFYAKLQRADYPLVEGTPLNASTFNEMVAMIKTISLDATVEQGDE